MGGFVEALGDILTSESSYVSAVSFAAFLAFGAVGEWVAERAGTLNISIEGMLLAGAFAAAAGFDLTGNLFVSLLFGIGAALMVALVQAQMSHRLQADQFVVGLALNILVLGLAGFLDGELDPATRRAPTVTIPLVSEIPLVGRALFDQSWLLYLIYPLIPACWWLVYRTRWGLEARSVGENPQSADASGIHVNRRRRQAIYVAGVTCGAGGTYLCLAVVGSFEDSIVGGRGFISIAAVIFGGWTLRGSIAGCVLFGTVVSFRLSLPALGYQINNQIVTSAPFLLTIAGMALFAKRVRAPDALSRPFVRGIR